MTTNTPDSGNGPAHSDKDYTMAELEACDYTVVCMGPNGPMFRSAKTGKAITEPVGTPEEQIAEMRRKKAALGQKVRP